MIHFLQESFIPENSITSPNSAKNWAPSVQIHGPRGHISQLNNTKARNRHALVDYCASVKGERASQQEKRGEAQAEGTGLHPASIYTVGPSSESTPFSKSHYKCYKNPSLLHLNPEGVRLSGEKLITNAFLWQRHRNYAFILFTILKLNILVMEHVLKIINHPTENLSFRVKAQRQSVIECGKGHLHPFDYGSSQHPEFNAYPARPMEVFTPVHHMSLRHPALLCMHFCSMLCSLNIHEPYCSLHYCTGRWQIRTSMHASRPHDPDASRACSHMCLLVDKCNVL